MSAAINFNRVSLLDRIKSAESRDELLALWTEGSEYEYASVNTQAKWAKASLVRKDELRKASEKPTEKPVEEAKPKPRAKTDRKGDKKSGKTKK